ncbi:MAG: NUDIX hydrolase, partial [Nitrospirota bacterium]
MDLSKKNIYKGRIVDLNIEQVKLPNGKHIELEVIHHPGASAIVPLRDNGQVVLIKQFRYAAGGFIYEIPAGRLNKGEDPAACAARELEEEIGYKAGRLEKLITILTTPGFC